MIIYGFHSIEALLQKGAEISSIYVSKTKGASNSARTDVLKKMAQKQKIPWQEMRDQSSYGKTFQKMGGKIEEIHSSQGIFAQIPKFPYADYGELIKKITTKPSGLLLFIDSITDPQNLGAILRSAAAFSLDGLVITEHRTAPLTPTAIKISSGGFAHVPIAKVVNMASALQTAQKAGIWIYGLSEHGKENLGNLSFTTPSALVVGNEEKGIRPLVLKNCDHLVRIHTQKNFPSLNAATASAIAMALVRQDQS